MLEVREMAKEKLIKLRIERSGSKETQKQNKSSTDRTTRSTSQKSYQNNKSMDNFLFYFLTCKSLHTMIQLVTTVKQIRGLQWPRWSKLNISKYVYSNRRPADKRYSNNPRFSWMAPCERQEHGQFKSINFKTIDKGGR